MKRALKLIPVLAAFAVSTPLLACDVSDPHAKFAASVEKNWPRGTSSLAGTVLVDGKVWTPPASSEHCGTSAALYEFSKQLSERLSSQGAVLLLGEMHDNREHHWVRSLLIAGLSPRKPAVVMEHLRANQSAGIEAFFAIKDAEGRPAGTVADLKRLVNWEKSGWSKYPLDELLDAIVSARLPIYAGDASGANIMDAARKGAEARPKDERTRLGLETPLAEALEAAAAGEIEGAHCGKMPADRMPGMLFAQRYRDAHLADAALRAAERHGASILLTGNGHARSDRGVPWYLRERSPERTVTTVQLIEVEDGASEAGALVPRDPGGQALAGYVILTPKPHREDPCKSLTEGAFHR